MPRKIKNRYESILDKRYDFDIQKLMDSSNSYKSLIYGIVTVVVLFIVLALGLRTMSQNKAQIDDGAVMTQKSTETMSDNRYVVTEGETLWSIAEKSYNDGFKWRDIAKANNISDPTTLEKGTRLVIPKLASAQKSSPAMINATPTPVQPGQQVDAKITGNSYKTVHGDYLWEIAVRAYGDGYRWVDIASANNMTNPDLIFSGKELKLPRP